ncbi:hypothetical protein [Dehalococcoides mccartyi]|jgi:adhesin/invasin|uniref:Ig domain-containing protein n=1 Tax=Dehalococcoides mccartyi TaxID=61435 RepID=A0A142VAF5_9CHLR|nr:hypothetical protein [Dehalococcoides mccartyi]AII61657.1 hypothetical protein X794_04840 [Dehalococcoides mccartyi CG5]AMU86823.1 Ig domain-containing protein [Dehalococcoides mccartyi]AOV99612.1 hypothetical protein DCWBC2_0985 [Dehalococcoides mccartyi]MBA2085391.1 hypothetical protein [Dehalococcoides mccartyi]QBX64151.1 hypothetical protein DhcFL2_05175 [Dehalococcoides mccartyi]
MILKQGLKLFSRLALTFALLFPTLLVISPVSTLSANTFAASSQLSVTDGVYTDWGSMATPSQGVHVCTDYSNNSAGDGSGFTNTSSDITNIWVALSSSSNGLLPASPSNLIENIYYRIDTRGTSMNPGQSYFIQLNLGIAPPARGW